MSLYGCYVSTLYTLQERIRTGGGEEERVTI